MLLLLPLGWRGVHPLHAFDLDHLDVDTQFDEFGMPVHLLRLLILFVPHLGATATLELSSAFGCSVWDELYDAVADPG